QVVSQLSHPNIVQAFDAGPLGQAHGLVMEYVPGIDLARLVKQSGPLPVGQACDYIRQAALGLQYCHEKGLVHRDIKPSNLLVTKAHGSPSVGLVKILDLGLARLQPTEKDTIVKTDEDMTSLLTPRGPVILGTPDYMAPEQAEHFHGADIRADIYSLGCTFYYLLAGQAPFAGGSSLGKLIQHQQVEPDWKQLGPNLSAPLQVVLQKMLAKRPEDRCQAPGEVAAALAASKFGSGGPLALAAPRIAPKRSHAPKIAFLIAGVLLISLALWSWRARSVSDRKEQPEETQ